MRPRTAGRLSRRRYTSRRRTRWASTCFPSVALPSEPSEPWIGAPVSQSISPRFQAASFFWYHGGYRKEARGVEAKVVMRAMTTKMVKVLWLMMFADSPMFCDMLL